MTAGRVVVLGGNGFVGTRVLQHLSGLGVPAVSVSRTGAAPRHVRSQAWAQQVEWQQGDALDRGSFAHLLPGCRAVITVIGYPPLPWADEDLAVRVNGETNANVIRAAEEADVPRVVLVNATMPQWAPAGYVKGKKLAEAAATDFVNAADVHGAVVLKPGAIFGTRHDAPVPLPLGLLLGPVSWVLRSAPGVTTAASRTLPYLLEGALVPPASVDNVAKAAVDGATRGEFSGTLTVVGAQDLATYHCRSP